MLKSPYLLFLGDAPDQLAAKVAQGSRTGVRNSRSGSSGFPAARPISASAT